METQLGGRVVEGVVRAFPHVELGAVALHDLADVRDLAGVDESAPLCTDAPCAYPTSKAAAEREVCAAHGAELATVALHEGNPLYIDLPASVELEITYTEPGLQGDRSTGGTKPATVETGAEIQVPLFLETGTKVKVDTRTGDYLGRVND